MRDFAVWKSQVMLWLIKLPSKGEDFNNQKRVLITKLESLRSRWLSNFLSLLYNFTDFWEIKIPSELLPSNEELENWLSK